MHPELVPVPVPNRIVQMIGHSIPLPVIEAEFAAGDALREIGRLRPLGSVEDRQDYEAALGQLARANKTLAAHHPAFVVRGAA
ncbi:hypothetical protein [Streptomyces cinereoruber]|uniref:hypothetical protein n=1 Tax=Streptomyces cinereoruber TaxID=67260 RepID=UPI0036384B56